MTAPAALDVAALMLVLLGAAFGDIAAQKKPHVTRGEYVTWVRRGYQAMAAALLLGIGAVIVAVT